MPTDTHEFLSKIGANLIDAKRAALMAGSSKAVNMVLLGALAKYLPFEVDTWKSVIEGRVPAKTIESNLKAFDLGYES
jgi:indolepyruvate ferredoxin oxidoreductase beta subunit